MRSANITLNKSSVRNHQHVNCRYVYNIWETININYNKKKCLLNILILEWNSMYYVYSHWAIK